MSENKQYLSRRTFDGLKPHAAKEHDMPDSLYRLERLRKTLNIRGEIEFEPGSTGIARYRLLRPEGVIPLGAKAQAARFMLRSMAGGK